MKIQEKLNPMSGESQKPLAKKGDFTRALNRRKVPEPREEWGGHDARQRRRELKLVGGKGKLRERGEVGGSWLGRQDEARQEKGHHSERVILPLEGASGKVERNSWEKNKKDMVSRTRGEKGGPLKKGTENLLIDKRGRLVPGGQIKKRKESQG